jgi:hypothetical protein
MKVAATQRVSGRDASRNLQNARGEGLICAELDHAVMAQQPALTHGLLL